MGEDPKWFWKNWRLGTELQVSGSFLYNAILCLDQMETFYYEEECFEFLYNTSIGIERLLKITIILTEHDKILNQEEFEQSLITHSSIDLLNRLKKNHKINLGKTHYKFLTLIDRFYRSTRYSRFSINSVYKKPEDKFGLINFLNEELKLDIRTDIMNSTQVTMQIRKFLGKTIGKFSTQLYEIIRNEAYRNNTYTYEISSESKAYKIFMAKDFTFINEKIVQREALIFLLRKTFKGTLQSIIDSIPSIPLESFDANKYIKTLFEYERDRQVLDEISYLYEEEKPDMDRIDKLLLLGSDSNYDFIDEFREEE